MATLGGSAGFPEVFAGLDVGFRGSVGLAIATVPSSGT